MSDDNLNISTSSASLMASLSDSEGLVLTSLCWSKVAVSGLVMARYGFSTCSPLASAMGFSVATVTSCTIAGAVKLSIVSVAWVSFMVVSTKLLRTTRISFW